MKKMGRPKGENNKDCICSIRIDEKTLKRLEEYCKKMHVAKSEAVREAIDLLVDDDQKVCKIK